MRQRATVSGWDRKRKAFARACFAVVLCAPASMGQAQQWDRTDRHPDPLAIVRAIGIKPIHSPLVTPPPSIAIEALPPVNITPPQPYVPLAPSMIMAAGYSEPSALIAETHPERIVMRVEQVESTPVDETASRVDAPPRRVSARVSDSRREGSVVAAAAPEEYMQARADMSYSANEEGRSGTESQAINVSFREPAGQWDQGAKQESAPVAESHESAIVRIRPTVLTTSADRSVQITVDTKSIDKADKEVTQGPERGYSQEVPTSNELTEGQLAVTPNNATQTEPVASSTQDKSIGVQATFVNNIEPEPRPAKSRPSTVQTPSVYATPSIQPVIEAEQPMLDSSPIVNTTSRKSENSISFPASVRTSSTVQVFHQNGKVVHMAMPFSQVLVEDDRICKVIPTGDRDFSVMGTAVGTTRIAVWNANGSPAEVTTIQIEVQKPWQGPIVDSSNDLQSLEQVIAQMHPRSKVELISIKDGSLVVRGQVDSQGTAKQILSMVRKLCLVPVKDELHVQSR